MPIEMILTYVPEIAEEEYSNLDLKSAAKIARERDLNAAQDLLNDISECSPNFSGESQMAFIGEVR